MPASRWVVSRPVSGKPAGIAYALRCDNGIAHSPHEWRLRYNPTGWMYCDGYALQHDDATLNWLRRPDYGMRYCEGRYRNCDPLGATYVVDPYERYLTGITLIKMWLCRSCYHAREAEA